jgi:beta-carotene 15,15'-dioxygenase
MLRILLLIVGLSLVYMEHFVSQIDVKLQFTIFLVGVLILGVPHGAADLLVAHRNETLGNKHFSSIHFLLVYVSKLLLFALTLWFFPVLGNILFIFFAAYHFGETDLSRFHTNTLLGKILVISYGLLILSIILMPHFGEVKEIFYLFPSGKNNTDLIESIDNQSFKIIVFSFLFFILSLIIYCYKNRYYDFKILAHICLQLGVILTIVYHLPMLLGFSYYFVMWHSILSLSNIITYLRKNKDNTYQNIIKQVVFYSLLAIGGIFIFGTMGFMLISSDTIMAYLFLGLAVLTAPHMEVMHQMYVHIRKEL